MKGISSPPSKAGFKTGTYVGNGADNRNIDIGIDLASKDFAYVIVRRQGTFEAVHRTERGQGDLTMFYYYDYGEENNLIQAFTSTGFQVGTKSEVNTATEDYTYIVFWN